MSLPLAVRPEPHDDWGLIRDANGLPFADTMKFAQVDGVPSEAEWDAGPPKVAAHAAYLVAAANAVPQLLALLDAAEIDADMAGGCLVMIADRLKRHGCKCGPDAHQATPPMMFDDWLTCVVRSAVEKAEAERDALRSLLADAVAALRPTVELHEAHQRFAAERGLDGDAATHWWNVARCPIPLETARAAADVVARAREREALGS